MKNLLSLFIALGSYSIGFSQAVTTADPGNMDPTKEIKIIVDLTKTTNDFGIIEAAASGEDMYIWTWKPAEHPVGHPLVNGLGAQAWKNSNDALLMTKESEGVYSFTMTPTEFYGVDAKTVYEEDIHLLVKPKDGGGYGDPDIKTEDLVLEFNIPKGASSVFTCIPNPYGPDLDTLKIGMDDVLSFVYNNNEDEKPSLQGVTEMYLYPELTGSDDVVYKVSSNAKTVSDFPSLMMTNRGGGILQHSSFTSSFISLFNLPMGVEPKSLTVICVRPNLKNTDDIVDDNVEITFIICD